MNFHRTLGLLALLLTSACISKSTPQEMRYFIPPLPSLDGQAVVGEQGLRLDRIPNPTILGQGMVWRLSETEFATDESNLWRVVPSEQLEQRLRDVLYSRSGFRETALSSAPRLRLQILYLHGDLTRKASAHLTVVADLWTLEGRKQHREQFTSEVTLVTRDAAGFAYAAAEAMDSVVGQVSSWVDEIL